MTAQQPTAPWTPERALSMFKEWNDPDLTMHEFCERWYVAYNPDDFARIAIEALESATAEIERLREERNWLEKHWPDQIADAMGSTGDAIGRTPSMVSMTVKSEIERQRARADKAEADLQCVTLTGDAVASDASLYKGNSVRHWWDKCQAYRGAFHDLDEARMEVERLKAELAKAQQQPEPVAVPSDEDETIRKLFNLISVTGLDKPREVKGVICYLISITKKLARRIGAKL